MPVSPVPGVRGEVDVTRTTRCLPVIIILLMLIIDGLGFAVALAPQTRLFEDIVCRQYYSRNADSLDSGPHEDSCKIPAVQDFVAQLFGWQTFFDGIPGLVLAMYFGVLADTRGRRAVLFWSMAGQLLGMSWVLMICAYKFPLPYPTCSYTSGIGWLELPLQLTWFSSLFLIIGGGSTVTSAVSMMVLTDSTSEEDRSVNNSQFQLTLNVDKQPQVTLLLLGPGRPHCLRDNRTNAFLRNYEEELMAPAVYSIGAHGDDDYIGRSHTRDSAPQQRR